VDTEDNNKRNCNRNISKITRNEDKIKKNNIITPAERSRHATIAALMY
jgi:hypothetical protein